MTLVREFNLYLTAGRTIPLVINVNQFDSGEEWHFTLFKEDGTQYIPSTGAIVGIKSDGLGIINSGTVVDGKVVIVETQQMTAAVGKATFELTIDSGTHGTANFHVLVEPKPGNNADLSESDLSLIQEALNAVSPLPTGGTVGQVLTKTAQGSAWSDAGTPTQEQVAEAVSDWADENITVETGVVIDTSLSVAGAAADAKKTGDEISDLKSQVTTATNLASTAKSVADSKAYISLNNDDTLLVNYAELQAVNVPTTDYTGLLSNLETEAKTDLVSAINEAAQTGGSSGDGLTSAIKSALMQLANNVAFKNTSGQSYIDDLYDALYPAIVVTRVTLNTNSLSFGALNTTQQLTATTTPSGGAVVWSSSNPSVATVSSTGLVTAVGYGNATITASCGNLTATCSVVVAQVTVTNLTASYTQSGEVWDTDSLDSLKSSLVVTAEWSNGTTSTVGMNDYTLSGTLTKGTSTVTVSYRGATTTFTVNVSSTLPTGYTHLDYVWTKNNSVATPIYLNTGVIPTANTSIKYKASRDLAPTSAANNSAGHIASCANFYAPHWKYASGLKFFANRCGTETNFDYSSAGVELIEDTPYEVSAYADGTNDIVLDGVTLGTVAAGTKNPTKQLTLFTYDGATNVAGYLFVGKLYSMQIYESSNLIRNYLPCKNENNVVGLYDTVNESFASSATANSLSEPE